MVQGLHLIWMTFCVQLICISSLQTDHRVAKGQLQFGCGQQMVHAFYKNPFEFKSPRSRSFSTKLVCALVTKPGSICDHARVIVLQITVVYTIIAYLAIGAVFVYGSRRYGKVREEWEKEYDVPRRFTYKSLYEATKGFNKDRNEKRKKKNKRKKKH